MHYSPFVPSSYTYVCTRITVRKKDLIPPEALMRLLNMDLSQIIRFIGETHYQDEVNELAGHLSGIDLLEAALTKNLSKTFQDILKMTPGALHELAEAYLIRWDIANVMLIIRGKQFSIEPSKIQENLIPGGGLPIKSLYKLLSLRTISDIADQLTGWEYHPIIHEHVTQGYRKGLFADMENDLYIRYYSSLYRNARSGIKGGDAILPHLRFEIDVTNIRNLLRLRAGSQTPDIRPFIIPEGNLNADDLQKIYHTEIKEQFVEEFEKKNVLKLLTEALREVRCNPSICELDMIDVIWKRWTRRETPRFLVMMAVNRTMLHHLDSISRRKPFSILPILSYLEHKRYEIENLRTIARGKQFGLDPEHIKGYLIL